MILYIENRISLKAPHMFGFFKKREPVCGIDESVREVIEQNFKWLVYTFGEEHTRSIRILTPEYKDFPIQYDGSAMAAVRTMRIVANQMQLNPEEIDLTIYQEGVKEISTGGALGNRLFTKQIDGEKYSGGLYWGKNEDDNKYHIGIEAGKLKDPLSTVATLAHEMAHIKLLGEGRIKVNNEPLTDLVTIIFGLGIFNANAAFQYNTGFDQWGWSKLGYLSQMEWGYALALFADLRGEENPVWLRYIDKNVRKDFNTSLKFIRHIKG